MNNVLNQAESHVADDLVVQAHDNRDAFGQLCDLTGYEGRMLLDRNRP